MKVNGFETDRLTDGWWLAVLWPWTIYRTPTLRTTHRRPLLWTCERYTQHR